MPSSSRASWRSRMMTMLRPSRVRAIALALWHMTSGGASCTATLRGLRPFDCTLQHAVAVAPNCQLDVRCYLLAGVH